MLKKARYRKLCMKRRFDGWRECNSTLMRLKRYGSLYGCLKKLSSIISFISTRTNDVQREKKQSFCYPKIRIFSGYSLL